MIEIVIDCRSVKSERDLHLELKTKLSFPTFYGCNLDALNDSLRESFADYIDINRKDYKEHLVFNFVGHEQAIIAIGEAVFNIVIDIFNSNINYWSKWVDAEIRLTN